MEQRRGGRSGAAVAQLLQLVCDQSAPCNFIFPLKDVFKNLRKAAALVPGVLHCQLRKGMKLPDYFNFITVVFGDTFAQEGWCFASFLVHLGAGVPLRCRLSSLGVWLHFLLGVTEVAGTSRRNSTLFSSL